MNETLASAAKTGGPIFNTLGLLVSFALRALSPVGQRTCGRRNRYRPMTAILRLRV
ncbi:MAG: hypothetical protein PVG33_07905 [Chloroflexota bacterium]|jgi:hypothetical protein